MISSPDTPTLRLRALEPEDLELVYRIENDPTFWRHGSTTVPYSRYALRQFIADSTGDIFRDGQVRLVIEIKEESGARAWKAIGFADLVNYPLCRDYPLRNIENRQHMTAYFDTLFDRSFRDRVRNLDSTDWCPMGWRGSMLLNGEIWFSEGVTAVNYSSPVEQAHRAKLIKAEIKSLHPSLQGNWEPVDRMKFSQGPYGFARVDANGDRYRLTLFAPDARVGDKPLINWEGELLVEGTARVETYTFQGPEGSAVYSPTSMVSGQPEFELTLKGQEPLELPCTACYYQPVKL